MQLLVPMKSILTLEGRRCNHGSGIFGTAVSSFLREPDLVWQQSVTRECDVWHIRSNFGLQKAPVLGS
jgi:hypothetical protein